MPLLSPLINRDEAVFYEITEAKRGVRRTRLRNAWPRVAARYQEYEQLAPNLEGLLPSSLVNPRRRDCLHCYDSITKPLDRLLSDILQIVPQSCSTLCQYCLIGEVDDVDHYVPKSAFPEFAVLPRNLVPVCPKCNRLKGEAWVTNGARDIFSLYYEETPALPYLAVTVNFVGLARASIKFSLEHRPPMSLAQFNRVGRHFTVLNLIDRYKRAAVEQLAEFLTSARAIVPQDRARVASFLQTVGADLAARHGINYWKAILAIELAENDGFFATAGIP
jgi:5-methylcytosine-specific restriction endonuclease McrA